MSEELLIKQYRPILNNFCLMLFIIKLYSCKEKFRKIAKFSFQQVTLVDVRKAIKDIRFQDIRYQSIYS